LTRQARFKDDTAILNNLTPTSQNIYNLAIEVGFDDCGIAPVQRLDEDAQFMDEWLAQGLQGNMDYLERNRDKRYDPSVLVPGAQTLIVCLLHFDKSGRDYHRTVKSLLYKLEARLKEEFGEDIVSQTHQHIFCDSAPMLERRWCVNAGLGFIGKNHQLIHPTLGSLVHPGEIVLNRPINTDTTSLPLNRDTEEIPSLSRVNNGFISNLYDICADCQLCLEACPTGALRNNVWDATQCIAYTTHHCLECQNICPFNL
jgi:epoxyqueuosine reductase